MIYPIVMYGDPVLRKRAKDIPKGSEEVKQLSEDMFETMHSAQGIGLAAPQIGKDIRMFVVDGTALEDEPGMEDFKMVFINAEIIEEDEEHDDMEEGCLSIPNIREKVARPTSIRLKYFDEDWNEHDDEFEGMRARIIQHEYDHIEGVLFIDYLTPFKKRLLKSKLSDISRGEVETEYRIIAPLRK